MTPAVEDVDFIVIGSGPAGEKAASPAAYFGKRVGVVVRSERVGGAPIGTAGVPTRTLRETALYLTGFRRADVYGVGMHLDARRITELARQRNEEVQSTMVARVRENLARNHVELVHGTARLGPDRTVHVRAGGGGANRVLRGQAVLIATGSTPLHPPDIPSEDAHILDADSFIAALHPIKSVLVIGSGGTEYHHAMVSAPAIGVYSIPEVGVAGITEEQARDRGLDYAVGRAAFTGNTRATIAGATEGMVKLIFDPNDRRVRGVHILGETAAEMVHVGQAVMQHGGTIDYFVHNAFNVPTWAEAYKYAAFDGLGKVEPRVSPHSGDHISVAERQPKGTKMVDR